MKIILKYVVCHVLMILAMYLLRVSPTNQLAVGKQSTSPRQNGGFGSLV